MEPLLAVRLPSVDHPGIPVLERASTSWYGQAPVSTQRIAAAHYAQMDATVAALRADHDAKVAELMAELEGTRGEKEKADTDLAYLKASNRKERFQWNKDRTALSRKVAETEARVRAAGDGVASPEEFTALQQALVVRDEAVESLRDALRVKEAQQDKLEFEVACASTAEADVDLLMIRVASLEKNLAQERDAKKAAEEEAEARAAEARGLDRRLCVALQVAAHAENTAATCLEETAKTVAEIREARAGQRHAELWLEKSLAEVDAVHAMLAHLRSTSAADTAAGADPHAGVNSPLPLFDTSMQTPHPFGYSAAGGAQPPSPAYDYGARGEDDAFSIGHEMRAGGRVEPTAQAPHLESPTPVLGATPAERPEAAFAKEAQDSAMSPQSSQCNSALQTPVLDQTRPVMFSNTRLRSRPREGRLGVGSVDEQPTTRCEGGGGSRSRRTSAFSPPTPTVLFGELTGEGGSGESVTRRHTNRSRFVVITGGNDIANDVEGVSRGGGFDYGEHGFDKNSQAAGSLTILKTPTKNGKTGEDMAASPLKILRSEKGRREKAEARVAELEAAAAATAAQRVLALEGGCTISSGRLCSAGEGADDDVWPRGRVGSPGAVATSKTHAAFVNGPSSLEQLNSDDSLALFARMDQERQRERVLGLIKEARTRLKETGTTGRGNIFGVRGYAGNGGEKEAGAAGNRRFPMDENAWKNLDPASEVASLIDDFEGKLTRSVDNNAQLRDFCSHLEGLLAAHEAKKGGKGGPSADFTGSEGDGRLVAVATLGNVFPAVGDSRREDRLSPSFALCRE